jgi:multisubunit Na+/H+ antiporter MnhF subunit
MNAWLMAATALLTGLVPLGVVVVASGSAVDRLVALELAGDVDAVILLLLAEGFHRSSYADLALVLALLSFAGSLVFARFLERRL